MTNDLNTHTGWTPPPTPPRQKSHRARWFIAFGASVILGGAIVIGAVSDGGDTSPAVVKNGTTQVERRTEARDLSGLSLTRASLGAGVTSDEVKYTIHNWSSKTSDYYIEYQITDVKTGERVYNSILIEDNVLPGQVVKGVDYPSNTEANPITQYKIDATTIDRTESVN
jgi:hypothetical protein